MRQHLGTKFVLFEFIQINDFMFLYKNNLHKQLPVVPPPGGSDEITPGNLRQRKSNPNL